MPSNLQDTITPLERTPAAFSQTLRDNLYYWRGQGAFSATIQDIYMALAKTVRDYLVAQWQQNVNRYWEQNPKFVYYFSAEYLLGRQLGQNLLYSGTEELARQALKDYDLTLEDVLNIETEPGLGNGGLGRLAACFMDSLATLGVPAMGYGIRYEYGIFKQSFVDGWQVESPDEWLYYGTPWDFSQPDDIVAVHFGGHTEGYFDAHDNYRVKWRYAETVMGEPSHLLVPSYNGKAVNLLRLWRARASKEFDFQLFDVGDYARAVEQKTLSENISKVLYPNDNTPQGRELRLRQQYFFVCCSLQDIIRRFHLRNTDWEEFPNIVAIQLNDTHPVIAIAELLRILIDEHYLTWEKAWPIVLKTFASTQHTLLPEALEKWPVSLFERLLPRHLELIYEINRRLLDEVRQRWPNDESRVRRMSIIEEGAERLVRMAYLACVGSHSINGVAELQSRLLRERVLHDFYEMYPERFNNKTNGVSPRRFLRLANPRLSSLISQHLGGEGWLSDLDQLCQLEPLAEDAAFRAEWSAVKRANKVQLAEVISHQLGLTVDPSAMFDVMVKRLHEYKRQLLKVLHIISLYRRLQDSPYLDIVPRVFVFGAKAAPGYHMAKRIIKLINEVGRVVNHDPIVRDRLKVAYLPNFNVTLGEQIYPAANLSEQISLAGKEASGTGNMKFALNGAVTIGTLDGANIEIRERVGADNFFLFGMTTEEVFASKAAGYRPYELYEADPQLRAVIDSIGRGDFSRGDHETFRAITDSLLSHDEYMLLADYAAYIAAQDRVDAAYRDGEAWTRMSILNAARCGFFSSDRAMRQYCEDIWQAKSLRWD